MSRHHWRNQGLDYRLTGYGGIGEEMALEAQAIALRDGLKEDADYWGKIAVALADERRRREPRSVFARNIIPFGAANDNHPEGCC